MERSRKRKLLVMLILCFAIVSLSIGFAAFSATLNISSSASVSPNSDTFSVKFSTSKDSLIVNEVEPSYMSPGISVSAGVIDNSTNPTISNLSATFTSPGQYVEYTFYARNEGEYTAYLNNINFIGDKTCTSNGDASDSLVQSACGAINITATIGSTTYIETTPIEGHILDKKTGEPIKVRLEYSSTGVAVDGVFSITFPNVALVYSTINDSSMQPTLSSEVMRIVSGDLDTVGSEICIGNGEECFYLISSNEEKVTLFAKYNLYAGYIVEDVEYVNGDDRFIYSPIPEISSINSSARGAVVGENGYEYKLPWFGVVSFSEGVTLHAGNLAEDVSVVYNYYLTELGANVLNTRLISVEELESLGCSRASESCLSAPSWVYATSFWTDSVAEDRDDMFWYVVSNGYLSTGIEDIEVFFGARPVVEIARSEFEED